MKKILVILAISIISISCKVNVPVDYVIFSGKITNKTADYIKVANNSNSVLENITVSENGTFLDTLHINSGIYLITDGTIYMRAYFEQGANLDITFDAEDFNGSLSFSGEGAAANKYLQDKAKKEREGMGDRDSFFKLDETAFIAKSNEIQNVLKQFLEAQQNLPEAYKEKEKRNIGYESIIKLRNYERSHAYATKNFDYKISSNFLPEMNNFDYNNTEDFEFSEAYKKLVLDHYKDISKDLAKSDNLAEEVAYLKVLSKLPNQIIKNTLLFEEAMHGIFKTSNFSDYYTVFINASTDKKNNQTITESYQKLIAVDKGKPSPKFYDYENNDGSTTSLDDLKGKYVYIDVWATWCGPCKGQVPFLKEVEKAYRDKNIEFLGLSIDSPADHDKWKKMIVDENLVGVQILADKAWDSKFVQDYLITGIPRFILLDPQGNIVTANAPRPSQSEKLEALFSSLNL